MRSLWLVHCILPWAVSADDLSNALAQLTGSGVSTASSTASPAAVNPLQSLIDSMSNPLSDSALGSPLPDLSSTLSSLTDLSPLNSLSDTLSTGSNLLNGTGLNALTDQLDAATNTLNSLNALNQMSGGTSLNPLDSLDLNSLAQSVSGLSGLTDQLDTVNSLTQQLQSLGGLGDLTSTLTGASSGSSNDKVSDLTGLGTNNYLNTLSGTSTDNHNNAVLTGLVNAFIQNGYLNQAGQTAIKMSGFAQEAYSYPDLVSALSGMTPCVSSNGELTAAVRNALAQMGIDATYPEDLVAYAMSKGFGVRRRLEETASLKDSIKKFNDAVTHAMELQQKSRRRRLQAGYGYPSYNPYAASLYGGNMGSGYYPPNGGYAAAPYSPTGGYGAMPGTYGGAGYGAGYPYAGYPFYGNQAVLGAYQPSTQFRGMDQKSPVENVDRSAPQGTAEGAKKLLSKMTPNIVPIPGSQYPELANIAEREAMDKMTRGGRDNMPRDNMPRDHPVAGSRENLIAGPRDMKAKQMMGMDASVLGSRSHEDDERSNESASDNDFHGEQYSRRHSYGGYPTPYGRPGPMMGNGPMMGGPMMGGPMMGGPMMGGREGMMGGPMMGGPMMGGREGAMMGREYGRDHSHRWMDDRHRRLTSEEEVKIRLRELLKLSESKKARQLSNWLDDAFNKVVSGVQSTNPEWKDDVQNAANDLASQLEDLAKQLQSGNLPDKLEDWFKSASDVAKGAIDEAGRHRRLQSYDFGMPLLSSLATPLMGGITTLTNPLMSNLGLANANAAMSRGMYPDLLNNQLSMLGGSPLNTNNLLAGNSGGALNVPALTNALSTLGLRRRLSQSDADALAQKIQQLSQAAQASSGKNMQGVEAVPISDDLTMNSGLATTNNGLGVNNDAAEALQSLGLGDLSSLLQGNNLSNLFSGLSATTTVNPSATTPAPLSNPGLNMNNFNLGSFDLSNLIPTTPQPGATQAVNNLMANGLDLNNLDLGNLMSGASAVGSSAADTAANLLNGSVLNNNLLGNSGSIGGSLGGQSIGTSTGSGSTGGSSETSDDLLALGDGTNVLNQAMNAVDLNSVASTLGGSNLDLSNMLQSLASSPVDLNELMNQLTTVDLNKLVEEAANSNVDLNESANQLSNLNLNNLLSGLGGSGLDLNQLTKGLLTGEALDANSLLKTGSTNGLGDLLANPDFSKMLNFMNAVPTQAPSATGSASTGRMLLASSRLLNEIHDLMQHQLSAKMVQRRLLDSKASGAGRRRLALFDFHNTNSRRLYGLASNDAYDRVANEYVRQSEQDEEPTLEPPVTKPKAVDIDFDQSFAFEPVSDSTKFVAVTSDLGFNWAFDEQTSLVAPIMACWQVDDLSVSEDDWPSFVVQSVTFDILDGSGASNTSSIDLVYTEAENLFRYYGKDWNKAQATQRRHNKGCTWVPMCGLHDTLNRMQTRGPLSARITVTAEKVPPTKELTLPQARVVVRAVAEQGTWKPVEESDAVDNGDFLLSPTAEIKQTFNGTPFFASELPRPQGDNNINAANLGGFAVSGYAVVASAESDGLIFKFDQEDWEYIPERARAAYGRILDQLKLFDESTQPDNSNTYDPSEEEDAEYEASAIAMFNAKRDLPVTVPEFTFLPRIVLEATSFYPSHGNRVVLQRCLPMSAGSSSTAMGQFTGGNDPLSATVLDLLYASAGATQTSIRMKSYLEAAPIQALVSSQEGFSTFDMRGTLIDDYHNSQWRVNVTLSPLNPAALMMG